MKKYLRFMTICIALTFFITGFSVLFDYNCGLAAEGSGVLGAPTANAVPLPEPKTTDTAESAVVLMYHHLVPDELYASGNYAGNNAIIPVSQFEEEMRYLYNDGYTTLLMSELKTYLQNDIPLPAKSVVITFDDGYESNYVYAYPILKKYNLKATIAVVVKSSENLAETAYNPASLSHLTFAQMREMAASGLVEIGSHSYDGHNYIVTENGSGIFFTQRKYLSDLGRSETEAEYLMRITDDLRLSKYILEREVGMSVSYFAYPYGVSNSFVREVLRNVGYEIAVTVKGGRVTVSDNILNLNRKNVDPGISLEQYAVLIDN